MNGAPGKPLTVSEFLRAVNELLETQVVWVEGEIADFRVSQGKWVHFDLKDVHALVQCFGLAFRLRTPLEDGMTVRVWGVPRVYPRSGRFSLFVERVEPAGEGALRRAFELLKEQLAREGFFDASRKRPVPRIPERVALLTSPEAAAYSDFINVLRARRGGMDVFLVPVPVQGEGAPAAIVRAIDWVSEQHLDLDALVLVRGGGSLADLHAFNDASVVRALARSRVPTIVGVGHERDLTLADLVADVRASTPSHAAELLSPSRTELDRAVLDLRRRLTLAVSERLRLVSGDTDRLLTALADVARASVERVEVLSQWMEGIRAQFASSIRERAGTLDRQGVQLRSRVGEALRTQSHRLAALDRLLAGLHPRRVLARGFSVTRLRPRGRIIRSARGVDPGSSLTTTLHEGSVDSTVTSVTP